MSFSPDFTLSYVSGGQNWKLTPSALPDAQQDIVLKALADGNLDTQDLATLAELQESFPSAFVRESYLDNLPLPEEFAMSRFSSSWDSMDMNALMAFLNEMLTDLAADIREQSSKNSINQIEHSIDLAEKKKSADLNSAYDAYAAAVVSAALAIVSAVVGFVGAVGSAVGTSKQLAKAKELALEKAQTLCDKFKAQKNFDSFDKAARKAEDRVKELNEAAKKAHPLGEKSTADLRARYDELKGMDTSQMSPAQRQARKDEADSLVTAYAYKKEAEKNEAYALTARNLAEGEKLKLEQAEKKLSAIDDDVRRLDAKSQELANLTRLISVMAPMFDQIGHMAGAKYTENGKIWDATSSYLSAQIQNTDALRELLQQNAQAFKELFDAVRDILQKYLEGQNQASSNIASHI